MELKCLSCDSKVAEYNEDTGMYDIEFPPCRNELEVFSFPVYFKCEGMEKRECGQECVITEKLEKPFECPKCRKQLAEPCKNNKGEDRVIVHIAQILGRKITCKNHVFRCIDETKKCQTDINLELLRTDGLASLMTKETI
ncbi:MAG: hypothetical protein V1664_01605, partial [Candidatus Uhrbacteria bacterium]